MRCKPSSLLNKVKMIQHTTQGSFCFNKCQIYTEIPKNIKSETTLNLKINGNIQFYSKKSTIAAYILFDNIFREQSLLFQND